MCGITGFYSPATYFNQEDLSDMTDSLQHRGPDASGYFCDGIVGLGHRRLSIIDLTKQANQPMFSHSGRYVMVYNGEVFNFREIAEKHLPGYEFKTRSDSEVVIELFEKLGLDLAGELNGMYAIAIYDKQEKTLNIIRDRLGKKPLYYYWDGQNFAFASELKAFKHLKRLKLDVNQNAIFHFLHLNFIPEPETIYQNIKKFPSGCTLRLSKTEFTLLPYWQLEQQIHTEHHKETHQSAKKTLDRLLTHAVTTRLMCDVPLGCLLSGGIDSSIITAIAQKNFAGKLKTFSIGFKESSYNESEYASKVAKHLQTDHTELIVSYKDAMDVINHVTGIYDEPFGDASAIPTLLVSRIASQYVKVALSGDGADELFMGYGSYQWARRLHHPLHRVFRSPIKLALRQLSNRYKRVSGLYDYEDIGQIRSHIFSQEQYFFSNKELQDILSPQYRHKQINTIELQKMVRKLSPSEAQSFFDMNYYLKDDLLTKVDRASMHYSLEIRNPFLDNDLVDWAINLPEHFKHHRGTTKFILKELLYDYVPQQFFQRPKQGFALPIKLWLRKELRYLLDDYTNPSIIKEYGILVPEKVTALKNAYLDGRDYLFNRLWLVIVLHKWLKENV